MAKNGEAGHRAGPLVVVSVAFTLLVTGRAAAQAPGLEDAPRYLVDERLPLASGAGRRVFTTLPLDRERNYTATISGLVGMHDPADKDCGLFGFFCEPRSGQADALYAQDRAGDFTLPHDALVFSAWSRLIEADVVAHSYRFELSGSGERLAVSLGSPRFALGPGLTLRDVGGDRHYGALWGSVVWQAVYPACGWLTLWRPRDFLAPSMVRVVLVALLVLVAGFLLLVGAQLVAPTVASWVGEAERRRDLAQHAAEEKRQEQVAHLEQWARSREAEELADAGRIRRYAWEHRDELLRSEAEIRKEAATVDKRLAGLGGPVSAKAYVGLRWRLHALELAKEFATPGSAKTMAWEAHEKAQFAQEAELKDIEQSRERYLKIAEAREWFVKRFGAKEGEQHYTRWVAARAEEEGA